MPFGWSITDVAAGPPSPPPSRARHDVGHGRRRPGVMLITGHQHRGGAHGDGQQRHGHLASTHAITIGAIGPSVSTP